MVIYCSYKMYAGCEKATTFVNRNNPPYTAKTFSA